MYLLMFQYFCAIPINYELFYYRFLNFENHQAGGIVAAVRVMSCGQIMGNVIKHIPLDLAGNGKLPCQCFTIILLMH